MDDVMPDYGDGVLDPDFDDAGWLPDWLPDYPRNTELDELI